MTKRTKQRNIIIIGLSCVVLLMIVGYAAFQSVLNINGTSNISSTWDIQITGITKDKTKGNVTEITEPTFDKESASFNVGLESPGDYIYYKIAVTNKGTLAAIAKLGNLSCGDNEAIECGAYADSNVTDIGVNTDLTSRRLIIGPNETEYYSVWIKYKSTITEQPDKTTSAINLKLTYEQSDVGITHTTDDKCYTGKVLENGTLSITDYDKTCGPDVVVPETIDGYTVTEIADGKWDSGSNRYMSAFSYKQINSVVIPDTLIKIGATAFANNNLTSLDLGSGVQFVGLEAFVSNQLTSLNIPSSLTSIGAGSFRNNRISSINVPSTVTYLGGGAFTANNVTGDDAIIFGRNSDGSIDYNTLSSYAGKNATGTTIPSVTTIGNSAYRGVIFNEVILPNTVKTVSQLSFSGSYIQHLELNDGLIYIGPQAFELNKFSGNLVIPNSVTSIGARAFNSNKIETVSIGDKIQGINENAFYGNPITSIAINRKEGSVAGSPWGASNATINWTGTN